MGKTMHRLNVDVSSSKEEILKNEERLQQKHRRSFSEMLSEDDEFNNFQMFEDDVDVDPDILSKYKASN